MNYYILPKNNDKININYSFIPINDLKPYISHSIFYYLTKSQKNVTGVCNKADIYTVELVNQMINTYEFIFENVPNSILSVSKIKPNSNLFYELVEIFSFCNIQELFENKNKICSGHFSPFFNSSIFFLNSIRDNNKEDQHIGYNFNITEINKFIAFYQDSLKYDILFFEFKKEDYKNNANYFKNLIIVLKIIIKCQQLSGITIIKLNDIFYKIVIDVLFILSILFEKVYIIKPPVSNVKCSDRFIFCKNFEQMEDLKNTETIINEIIQRMNENPNEIIHSIISNNISYYFINKIEESNVIIAQQQLEVYDQIINIIKSKNKDDKIETLKRNNIQKCIIWCEKYKIPHNKFIDKTNIFLNAKIVKDVDTLCKINDEDNI